MTELLYLTDCYLCEFDAKVIALTEDGVVLDKTCFYPLSGGQPSDTGKLIFGDEEHTVTFVQKTEEGIVHCIEGDLEIGDKVRGIIDWEKRYKSMRYHTASHILSTLINKDTGALITGNMIGEEKSRVDFNLEAYDKEQIFSFEQKVNEVIRQEKEVKISFVTQEEAQKEQQLRKLAMNVEMTGDIRIIEIQGIDRQACGGTHVKNTGEIKGIKILKSENKGKNNRRAYFTLIGE